MLNEIFLSYINERKNVTSNVNYKNIYKNLKHIYCSLFESLD